MKKIVRLFDDVSVARGAVEELLAAGFAQQQITLIAYDPHGDYATFLGTPQPTGDVGQEAATGAGIGALIGGIGGLLLGLGALTITGIGPIVAAGPIAAALMGAGTGATVGGLVGLLLDADLDEGHAQLFAEGVRRGGTLVVVEAEEGEAQQAEQIVNRHGPVNLEERSAAWQARGWSGYRADDLPYAPDDVELEQSFYTFEPVFRQHYERTAAGRGHTYARYEPAYYYGYDLVARGGYHDREWDEIEAEVKRDWESRDPGSWEEFSSAVRYAWEEARQALSMEDVWYHEDYADWQPEFQQHYEATFAGSGRGFPDLDPAYRFGYDLAMDERYDGREWDELEPEAQLEWERRGGGPWQNFREAVQHAWDQVTAALSDEEEAAGWAEDRGFDSDYDPDYAGSGYSNPRYHRAYSYGLELANDERYRGRSWEEVESDARSEWQIRGEGLWEEFRDAVRDAWHRATGGDEPRSWRDDRYDS